jgi:hypothetical protein
MTAPTPLFDDGTTRLVALDLSDGSRLVLAFDSKGVTRAPGIAVLPAGSDLAPAGGGSAPTVLKLKRPAVASLAAPAPEPAPAAAPAAAPSPAWGPARVLLTGLALGLSTAIGAAGGILLAARLLAAAVP